MEVTEQTTISSSTGEHYNVKPKTKLFTHTGYQAKDDIIYSEPHIFKLDRFLKAPPRDLAARQDGSEPLPTVIFACPYGHIDQREDFRTTHRCPSMHFAQPMLKEYVKLMVTEFTWDLNYLTKRTASQLVLQHGNPTTGKYLHVNMLPDVLRGGIGADDQVIATPIKPFFVSFKSVHSSGDGEEDKLIDRK
jgi:cytochrome P450